MKIGLSLPQIGEQATRENVLNFAIKAEQEGFDSLWVLERLIFPLEPKTPYPVTPDGSLPAEYKTVFDPIALLSFVAGNTKKIALGTSVIDMLYHNPVVVARWFATLDQLSQGRAICGLGVAWSKDEFDVSNVPFERRGARADEFLEALKRIWISDVAEFDGEFYKIPRSIIGPRPVQKPHPPIYLGGFTKRTFRRVAKYADGWNGAVAGPLEYLSGALNMMREEARNAGRDPSQLKVLLLSFPNVTDSGSSGSSRQRFPLTGTLEEVGGDLQKIKEMGVDHIIFSFIFSPKKRSIDDTIDLAKKLSKFAR